MNLVKENEVVFSAKNKGQSNELLIVLNTDETQNMSETNRPSPEGLETNDRKPSELDLNSGHHVNLENQLKENVSSENAKKVSTLNHTDENSHHQIKGNVAKQDIDLLLLGKTGHGKSATGNSIAKRQVFKTSSDAISDTIEVGELYTEIEEYTVHVVDTPGFAETRFDSLQAKQKACTDMAQAMAKCPKGFHALLLVLRYGDRFTNEEQEAITILKNIFGTNIVQDYCIIIITYGDCFDLDVDDGKFHNFNDWLSKQEGALKHLFIECKYRCLLFRNRTKDVKQKQEQVRDLLKMVKTLTYREVRYTSNLFDSLKMGRDKLMVEANLQQIKDKTEKETHLILEAISRIEITEENLETVEVEIKQANEKILNLRQFIQDEDKETGLLHTFLEDLKKAEILTENVNKAKNEKKNSVAERERINNSHQIEIANVRQKQAEEKAQLLEKLQTATETEKSQILNQLRENEEAAKKREQAMMEKFNKKINDIKEESDRKLKESIDKLKTDHAQQIQTLQKTLTDMYAKKELALQTQITQLTAKLEEAYSKTPKKDPNKIELKCRDQQRKCVNVQLDKHDQLVLLMRAYCEQYRKDINTLRFVYDCNSVKNQDTPDKLGLEDGDLIEVFTQQLGGKCFI